MSEFVKERSLDQKCFNPVIGILQNLHKYNRWLRDAEEWFLYSSVEQTSSYIDLQESDETQQNSI